MKLKFVNQQGLEDGIEIFGKRLGFSQCDSGILVEITQREGDIEVSYDGVQAEIVYDKKICFFRALGLLVEGIKEGATFSISETPQFDMGGAMFDVSRNAALTVDSIKDFTYYMAVMGLNTLMLYTEEMYIIEDEPYFGHMRGRYSLDELKFCDDYAYIFGIEVIPCIQALGHMERFLQWKPAKKYADTGSVMLAGSEEVYELIDKMLSVMSKAFRSRRIHLGMDEANDLGLGAYLKKNGYTEPFDILQKHLKRVTEIAENYGYRPMIWSDMYFHLTSSTHWYAPDRPMPQNVIDGIPENVDFVYWDYYHDDKEFYEDFIRRHKQMGKLPVFAGGIWIWTSISADYRKTFITTNSALEACKSEGVKEVFATLWMNSATGSFYSSLLGLQLYAEHMYSNELDMKKLCRRVKFCTGVDYDDYIKLSDLDNIPGMEVEVCEPPNPSQSLLWQDVLIGLYDKEIEDYEISEHYSRVARSLASCDVSPKMRELIFDMPQKACEVIAIKGEMGIRLKKAYDEKDNKTLHTIANTEIPKVIQLFEELHEAHRRQWFAAIKPFGFEVLDIRYGGAVARLKSAQGRINDYLEGRTKQIDELIPSRIRYFTENPDSHALHWTKYNDIVTPSVF